MLTVPGLHTPPGGYSPVGTPMGTPTGQHLDDYYDGFHTADDYPRGHSRQSSAFLTPIHSANPSPLSTSSEEGISSTITVSDNRMTTDRIHHVFDHSIRLLLRDYQQARGVLKQSFCLRSDGFARLMTILTMALPFAGLMVPCALKQCGPLEMGIATGVSLGVGAGVNGIFSCIRTIGSKKIASKRKKVIKNIHFFEQAIPHSSRTVLQTEELALFFYTKRKSALRYCGLAVQGLSLSQLYPFFHLYDGHTRHIESQLHPLQAQALNFLHVINHDTNPSRARSHLYRLRMIIQSDPEILHLIIQNVNRNFFSHNHFRQTLLHTLQLSGYEVEDDDELDAIIRESGRALPGDSPVIVRAGEGEVEIPESLLNQFKKLQRRQDENGHTLPEVLSPESDLEALQTIALFLETRNPELLIDNAQQLFAEASRVGIGLVIDTLLMNDIVLQDTSKIIWYLENFEEDVIFHPFFISLVKCTYCKETHIEAFQTFIDEHDLPDWASEWVEVLENTRDYQIDEGEV